MGLQLLTRQPWEPQPQLLPEWPQTADFSVSSARADQISVLALGHPPHPSPIAIFELSSPVLSSQGCDPHTQSITVGLPTAFLPPALPPGLVQSLPPARWSWAGYSHIQPGHVWPGLARDGLRRRARDQAVCGNGAGGLRRPSRVLSAAQEGRPESEPAPALLPPACVTPTPGHTPHPSPALPIALSPPAVDVL